MSGDQTTQPDLLERIKAKVEVIRPLSLYKENGTAELLLEAMQTIVQQSCEIHELQKQAGGLEKAAQWHERQAAQFKRSRDFWPSKTAEWRALDADMLKHRFFALHIRALASREPETDGQP